MGSKPLNINRQLERVMGIEPTSSAWKAVVLPLNYTRMNPNQPAQTLGPFTNQTQKNRNLVEGEGFEPSKAVPSDLQSDPFDRSGTPPGKRAIMPARLTRCQTQKAILIR
jgi:hypothetical protein